MLNHIVQFALRHRGVVVALAVVVIVYGLYTVARTRLDVFPEFSPPQVELQTEAPGLSPEEVEQMVTTPLESSLNGTPGLDSIRSQSIQGLSVITMVFRDNTDIFRDRQLVTEKLGEVVNRLPQGAGPPRMGPLTSSTSLTMVIGLTATNRTPMDLRTFADWTLRPYLLSVPGVATVDLFGGDIRQLQVQIKPDRLRAYGLSVNDVLAAAQAAGGMRGAGYVENPNQRIVIQTLGQSLTPQQLGDVVLVAHDGLNVRLRDVADVLDAPAPKFGDAQVNGQSSVVLLVYAQYNANTLDVTRALDNSLARMKSALSAEKINVDATLFRPANFIEAALRNVKHSLFIGAVLVGAVLFLFLLDWRTALISFVSIPLSLLSAVIVLNWLGVSVNTITLGGFAIAIGVVVDDAIIDVENILRRLRENSALPGPRSLLQVVLGASLEVRSAVVYATFIVALVFLPVLMMGGVEGRLFAPLGISFIFATLSSLAVALTVTPALCYLVLSRVAPHLEPGYVRWLRERHVRRLEILSRRPRTVMWLAVIVCCGAAATLPSFGGEFMPDLQEGHYVLHMSAVPGTSLRESIRLGKIVAARLLKNRYVRSVEQQAGRTENGEDTDGPHYSELHVDLGPLGDVDPDDVQAQIRSILGEFPGLTFTVESFLAERMEETISGASAEFVINIFGNDLDTIDKKAGEVQRVLSQVPGAVDISLTTQPGLPELSVRLLPDRLLQYGFRPGGVLNAIETAYEGTAVSQIYDGNRVFDVVVILDDKDRTDPETIGSLQLRNGQGLVVPLRELASIELTDGRYDVMHEGGQRLQQVTCNVAGRDVASFAAAVRQAVATKIHFPSGTYAVYTGAAKAEEQARRDLIVHSLLAGTCIVLLLATLFRSARPVLLILTNLPFALVGGVLAVFASGGLLSVGSLIGFVTLFGISLRNSIMLISHFDHLVNKEGMTWGPEAAFRGTSERLLPILMTASITGLGLLPLAIGSGDAGREIEGPMAIVIVGGLITSTLLNLLVLPTLALRYGKFTKRLEDGA
ncbi:MAG TPA: efflux RND transporter permease subunit [Verrucomicrobiae bacterium]|nr:efflux RND transporter permease subunit [Verrucomicrobiae bacterium]